MSTQVEIVRQQYPTLFAQLSQLLFTADPVHISSAGFPDEYEPEVATILPRLEHAQRESDVLDIIHEEFVRWFDASVAGPKEKYTDLATQVWSTWTEAKAAK